MSGLILKQKLKSLCCSNGWSYGVFWCFDQINSMLLTMEDAYYEEEMGVVVKNMLSEAHMLGEGIVGQAASTGKHQWIFADASDGGWNSGASIGGRDIFQDDSEIHRQFSSGIKTIAVISVESQGVVQFGSTLKILERDNFLDQTRRLFGEMENVDGLTSKVNSPSSLNCESCDLNEWFDSFCNGNITPMLGGNCNELTEMVYSSMDVTQSSAFTSDAEQDRMNPLCLYSSLPTNQSNTAVNTEAQMIFPSNPSAQFQQLSSQSLSMNKTTSQTPCTSTWSSGDSNLTSWESKFQSEMVVQDPATVFSTERLMNNQHSAPSIHVTERETSLNRFPVEFNPDDLTIDVSGSCVIDNILEWSAPSTEHSITGTAAIMNGNLSQPGGVTSASSGLTGDLLVNIPLKQPATSALSSVTETYFSSGKEKSVSVTGAENDLFEGLGLVFGGGQTGRCWEDMMMPVARSGQVTASTGVSECISELDGGSRVGPQKGLFSELGIEELLDSVNSSYVTKSSIDDQLSNAKRRRMENSLVSSGKLELVNASYPTSSRMMQPAYNVDKKKNLPSKQEAFPRSQVSLWIDDSYSVNSGSSGLPKPTKSEELAKSTKKRARPGESTRPRPKDRQQIQDRIKELKQIIPDGAKCSIDALLDRTIKHMLFLQSVTKYAERLKQADEPKLIGQENRLLLKDNTTGSGGATWALEVADQSMVCPIIVEDLNQPGLMLIEMLCEDRGFFLETADVIKGFGLNILKGLMESRENKIWARFIVEAKVHITRVEVFWYLLQLLERTGSGVMDSTNQPSNSMHGRIPELNPYQLPALPCPVSLAETIQ
ncbi:TRANSCRIPTION FACTOR BHLH155-LIKE ISOFORM X1-RELATED [Salix viminalis]|uniref:TRANSCRIPTION FACTOR BHLH155-LIKE ISOFORM X1-RELATED n=1 Tax=Salix viminalis TaxID=40686 RepID=A0A9Q0YY21_SALVM|nr:TRANSCRIPTION FACTOR BHLH155-LIKE ISOFORM X1-RELATED [Salix viminalis]